MASLFISVRSGEIDQGPIPNFWLRYPLVELTTAALFALAWYRVADPAWLLVVILVLISVLIGGFVAIIVYAARLFGFNRILIPYGPYLIAGGIVSMLYFRSITDWIAT